LCWNVDGGNTRSEVGSTLRKACAATARILFAFVSLLIFNVAIFCANVFALLLIKIVISRFWRAWLKLH
jgi:hypothetical protein